MTTHKTLAKLVFFLHIRKFRVYYFEKKIDLPFENEEFSSPSGWHEVLTALYGEYMVIPKEHERYNHEVKGVEE